MIRFKYKGRSFSNARSLTQAMVRDVEQTWERNVRSAAAATGVRVTKTVKGLEVRGSAPGMSRFHRRLGN